MNTCKHCKWWRISIEVALPQDYGQCMYDPPAVFCHYDDEDGDAAMIYERPQTYGSDFCSRFESGKKE
jgi:hypothetical protein